VDADIRFPSGLPASHHFYRTGSAGANLAHRAFSLVEVVLALGIFSFAMVAVIAMFSGVSKNTRSLVDRDATVAVWQALSAGIAELPSGTISSITTNASGQPELFARVVRAGASTNPLSVAVTNSPTGFTNAADGRLYRATLHRGLSPAWPTNPAPAYYPLRVKVDVFAADAYTASGTPLESTTLNMIWNVH
jgi:type II secretory pathway pseudopilin PulG